MNEFDILRATGKLQDRAIINNIKTNNNIKTLLIALFESEQLVTYWLRHSLEKITREASLDAKGLVEQARRRRRHKNDYLI